jgi:glycosyltransferase involved in cell wall biosynthesis
MKRIVSIVWFKILPAKYGGQKGIALFNTYLSDHFELICLCTGDNEAGKEKYSVLPTLPTGKKQFLFPSSYFRILTTIQKLDPPYVIIEHPYYGIAGIACKLLLNKKLIVHTHNIEYLRFRSQGTKWWRLLYILEKLTLKKADLLFFKTKDDMELVFKEFKLKKENCKLIPYGVEKQNVNKAQARELLDRQYNIGPFKKILLFAATLDYKPNAEAVELIYSKIAPMLDISNYVILICGRNKIKGFEYLKQLKAKGVIYCGEVEEIKNYFGGADVFIDPVMEGGGIQSKILEAVSYDLNVVCFSHMLKGIEPDTYGNKIFKAEPEDFGKFCSNIEEACLNSKPTPEAFFDKYEWKKIAADAALAIEELN